MLPPPAVGLIDHLRFYPHLFVHPEKGEDAPEDGIVVLLEVAGADDEDLLPVEGPVEVPQLEAVETAPAIRAHPRQRAARARIVAAPQPQGLEQQREP